MAQTVPSYAPTNGLVGYWGFDGDAKDYSGNNNHGTVNGATLTTDRNGVANKAYSFDGSDEIVVGNNSSLNFQVNNSMSVSFWFKTNINQQYRAPLIQKQTGDGNTQIGYNIGLDNNGNVKARPFLNMVAKNGSSNQWGVAGSDTINNFITSDWFHLVLIYENGNGFCYVNGLLNNLILNQTGVIGSNTNPLLFGSMINPSITSKKYIGQLDEIAIYNRALIQQEITALYTGCNLNSSITPIKANVKSGDNTSFTASAADGSATFQWQTQPAETQWMNLPTNQKYNGATTKTLTVNNLQLSNHNQPFRVIATAGTCKDTSDVATIQIADTCLITVHDTLVINRTITGLSAPNNKNTIKVYPNPAKDHVVIHYGNFAMMNGYSVKITNTLGQELFASPINQQTSSVNLSNWNSHSLYFIHIIDPQGKTVETRKILIE